MIKAPGKPIANTCLVVAESFLEHYRQQIFSQIVGRIRLLGSFGVGNTSTRVADGRLRDEMLNESLFRLLPHARRRHGVAARTSSQIDRHSLGWAPARDQAGLSDMLPPVLEIYVVWHPDDPAGQTAANQFIEHFHGTLFSGLIGGAIEAYVRSRGWRSTADAPRPIPIPDAGPPNGVMQAAMVAMVPVLGREFARAVEAAPGPWRDYATNIATAERANPGRVCVFPLLVHRAATNGTELGRIFGRFQFLAAAAPGAPAEPEAELRCRDLAQSIAQLAGQQRLRVFISHTKHPSAAGESGVTELIDRLRWIIGQTRLSQFFDANDLQPGRNWDEALREGAAVGALIALRTDLYSSREWCQREMLIAKQSGLPVVILDAPGSGDERGSFLMDHVPRVPVHRDGNGWSEADIRRGLNLLVDESLKRALWERQAQLAQAEQGLEVAWWAPHAPEPATLVHWLKARPPAYAGAAPPTLRVLHPDPPLGPDERLVLDEIAALRGLPGLDIMTPRLLAARGG